MSTNKNYYFDVKGKELSKNFFMKGQSLNHVGYVNNPYCRGLNLANSTLCLITSWCSISPPYTKSRARSQVYNNVAIVNNPHTTPIPKAT